LSRKVLKSLRLPESVDEAVKELCKETELNYTTVVTMLIKKGLEELHNSEEFKEEFKLKTIDALMDQEIKHLEQWKKKWKAVMANHPKAYMLKDLDSFKAIHTDEARIKRIVRLAEDPELKELIEGLLSERLIHLQKLTELQKKKNIILKNRGLYKSLEDILKEIPRRRKNATASTV